MVCFFPQLTRRSERAHHYECEKSLRGRVGVNIVHKKALSRTDHSA